MSNYQKFISEAPLSYDEPTKGYARKDVSHIDTRTKWSSDRPPRDANPEEVTEWVEEMIKARKVSGWTFGGIGRSKVVLMNDEKTVFKYAKVDPIAKKIDGGNQIAFEVDVYNSDIGKKYKSILPRLYDYGTYWMIQQKIPFVEEEFIDRFESTYNTDPYHKITIEELENICAMIARTVKFGKKRENQLKELHEYIKKTYPNLKKIIDFGLESDTYRDWHDGNFGMDEKGNVYVIDFGFVHGRTANKIGFK